MFLECLDDCVYLQLLGKIQIFCYRFNLFDAALLQGNANAEDKDLKNSSSGCTCVIIVVSCIGIHSYVLNSFDITCFRIHMLLCTMPMLSMSPGNG